MNSNDLILLRKKIAQLSDWEIKERDLYLKKISMGQIQGPVTGYASIDKPWLRYHSDEAIMFEFKKMSVYQLMYSNNKEHKEEIMLEYFGKQISYGEVFEKIDLVAKSLIEFGVKKNDVVIMSLPNCPETVYLFYALNKIGAIVDTIDPRYSKASIIESIEESGAKYFFAISMMLANLCDISDNVKIVDVSPYNSMPILLRILSKLKKSCRALPNNTISWNEFLKKGKKSLINSVEAVYEADKCSIICHTGGSTGTPKGVELTNEQFNSLIYQLLNNDVGLNRGNSFLNILPPFVAMGLDDGLHLAACAGIKQILVPSINPDEFPRLVLKYKTDMVLCGPIHCNSMMADKKMKRADLSFLKLIMYGGGEYANSKQIEFNEFLKSRGANIKLYNGYGATETCSGSACQKDSCYKLGSAGAPYIGYVDGIFDPDTQIELCGIEQVGELYVSAPTLMNGYYGFRSKETNDVIFTDEAGNRWYKSGDLAHFDEEGMLFIDGRIKRIITRRAYKIYPQYIEQLINRHPYVKEVGIVGIADPDDLFIPVANIALKTEYIDNEEAKQKVIDFCNEIIEKEVSDAALMAGFNFWSDLPKTGIGKLDFKKLEKVGIISENSKIEQKRYIMN